jgi:hypothetical protein
LLAGCRQADFCFEYLHLLAGGRRHLLAGCRQTGFDFEIFAFFCPSAGFRLVSGNICLLAGARLIFYFRLSPSSGWWHLLAGCRQAGFCFEYPHLLAGGRRHLLAGYCQAGFDFNFFAFFCPSAAF